MVLRVLAWRSGMSRRETTHQLVRYGIVGLATNAVGYLVYLMLTFSGLTPKLTMTTLYCLGATLGFFGNRRFTFRDRGNLTATGKRYLVAHVSGYFLNLILLMLFVDWLGLNHKVVQGAAILVVALFLFVVFKYFVFKTAIRTAE